MMNKTLLFTIAVAAIVLSAASMPVVSMTGKPFFVRDYVLALTRDSAPAGTFKDMGQTHWARTAVLELAEEGILTGYPDGSFRPQALVTYGEFIKMATVADGMAFAGTEPSTSANQELPDSSAAGRLALNPGDHWAKPFYDAGLNLFYFSRYDIRPEAMDQPIPRAHMALIAGSIMRNAGIKPGESEDYSKLLEGIQDVDSRTPYEYQIITAYAAGVLTGYPDSTFRPELPLTRAEAAVAISRLRERLAASREETEKNRVAEGSVLEQAGAKGDDSRPDEPLVIENDMDIFPEGTTTLSIHHYGSNLLAQQQELLRLLVKYYPLEGNSIYLAAKDFAGKPPGPGKQGMRKQYFGDRPVLMERLDTTVRIFVLPIGYTNRFWETKPGQINEEFF